MKRFLTSAPPILITLLSCLIILASGITARGQQWAPIGGPEGGASSSLVRTKGAILAGSNGSGIFRSTDLGATWQHVFDGMAPTANIIGLAADEDTVYAATNRGLYRSVDDGVSWGPVPSLPAAVIRAVAASEGFAIAGDDSYVYRIAPDGSLMGMSSLPTESGSLTSFKVGAQAIFAVTSTGIFRSTDNGDTWSETRPDTSISYYATNVFAIAGDIILASIQTRGLFRSTDNGDNWSLVLPPPDPAPSLNGVNDLAISGDTIFAATTIRSPLLISTDAGVTWNPLNNDSGAYGRLLVTPEVLIAGRAEFNGLGRSTDRGITWSNANRGIVARSMSRLIISEDALLASTIDGPYRMLNGSGQWERTAPPEMKTLQSQTIFRYNGNIFIGTGNGVFRSSDNGGHWVEKSEGMGYKWVDDFTSANGALFAVSFGWLYRSSNDGEQWMHIGAELNTVSIKSLASFGSTLLAAGPNGIWRSTNQGSRWDPSDSGIGNININTVVAVGPTFYALTRHGLYRSVDDGRTWSEVSADLREMVLTALASRGEELYVASSQGVMRSTDNGATWAPFNDELYDPRVTSLAIGNGTLYATTFGNGAFKVQLPVLGVPGEEEGTDAIALSEATPNPLATSTTLRYHVPRAGHVRLELFDPAGRQVRSLFEGSVEEGEHEITIDGSGLASGVYYCRMKVGSSVRARMLVIDR